MKEKENNFDEIVSERFGKAVEYYIVFAVIYGVLTLVFVFFSVIFIKGQKDFWLPYLFVVVAVLFFVMSLSSFIVIVKLYCAPRIYIVRSGNDIIIKDRKISLADIEKMDRTIYYIFIVGYFRRAKAYMPEAGSIKIFLKNGEVIKCPGVCGVVGVYGRLVQLKNIYDMYIEKTQKSLN